ARAEIEPAQQNDLITSIVAAKTENMSIPNDRPTAAPPPERPAIEEDIFVNQKPSLTWSTPTGPLTTQPATELVQNPKAAILRARDQFRQRRRNEGRLADRQVVPPAAPLIASAREAQLLEDRDLGEPDPRPDTIDPRYENRPLLSKPERQPYDGRKPVKPVSIDELARPFPSMTDFPEDRKRFESVPSLQSSPDDVVELDHVDTVLETRLVDAVPSDPYVVDDLFEEDERLEVDAEEPYESFEDEDADLSVHHRESILNRFLRQRRERRQHTEHYDDGYVEADAAWDEPAQRAYVPEQSVQSHERAHRSDYPQAPDGAGDRPSTGTEHARPAPRPHEPEPASMASGPPMEEYDIAQLDEAFDSRELDRLRYAEPERQAEPTRDHHHVEPSTDRPGESAYDAMEWVEPEYPSFRTRDEIHVRSRTEERIQRPQISRQQDARSTQPANDQTEAFDAPLWETVPTPPRDYRSAYRGEHSHPGNDRIATERSNSRPRNDQPNPQLDWPNTADNIQGPIAHAERRDDGYRSEERSSRAQRPNRAGDIGDILDDED
ncbi:MAG: hypothetical protein KC438_14895, partial [Thermomicrobiales bacterium]|nr:hypothetical protein [Thermomicrobiales bacterium]